MTWDRMLFLVLFGVAATALWALAKWGVGAFGWQFGVGMFICALLVAWLIDRRSKPDSE